MRGTNLGGTYKARWDYWENDLNNGIPRDTFILTVINGAYDGPSAADKALLNNKHDASMYYSEQLALNPAEGFDSNISKVLNKVTADRGTVTSAMEVIDYAMNDPITVTGHSRQSGLVGLVMGIDLAVDVLRQPLTLPHSHYCRSVTQRR